MASAGQVFGVLLGAGVAAALIHRAFKPRSAYASTDPRAGTGTFNIPAALHYGGPMSQAHGWSTKTWIPSLTLPAMQNHVPLEFALAWINEESGGNPCAIGRADQHGPDGNYREMGIAQLYNPDDLTYLKIKGSDLRAYCSADPNRPQDVIRDLTPAEIEQQANAAIGLIVKVRNSAAQYLNQAGCHWSPESVDFWRMVKLVHGLPGLQHGVVAVAKYLGRAPTSWKEFRTTIENNVKLDASTEAYRNNPPKRINFSDIFNNAEQATAGMHGPVLS